MYELDFAKFVTVCVTALQDRGYQINQSSDFESLEREMRDMGKPLISPNMSSSLNDFSDGNAYWLTLRESGQLAAVLGARLDHAGEGGLARLLTRSLSRLYPTEAGPAIARQSSALDEIRGDVIYFGDLFIRPSNRGSRTVLTCFVHLMQGLSFMKWGSAHWIYAFHRAADVMAGRADQYGFGNRWPRAQVWRDPPHFRDSTEYLSTIARSDFKQRIQVLADAPDVLTGWDRCSKSASEAK